MLIKFHVGPTQLLSLHTRLRVRNYRSINLLVGRNTRSEHEKWHRSTKYPSESVLWSCMRGRRTPFRERCSPFFGCY